MELIYFFLALLIFGGFLLLYMYRQAFGNRVLKQELRFRDFPSSFGSVTIFFISDVHKRVISDAVIAEAKGKADLVIIGGDLAEKGVALDQVSANIEKLKTIAPVFLFGATMIMNSIHMNWIHCFFIRELKCWIIQLLNSNQNRVTCCLF